MRAAFLARLSTLERRLAPRPVLDCDPVTLMQRAIGAPDAWQQTVLTTPFKRQLILCSRQSGKSSVVAVLAVATALRQPGSLILLLSPSLRQSQELFKKVQDIYRAIGHPAPLLAESALRYELDNGSRLIALPGTESTIRGYSGVDLLVVDEAARVYDYLYYAVRPMLAVSGGAMVCLSTPFGKRAWFYQAYQGGEAWQRVTVTADQCPRISASFLEEERRTLPASWYASEYLCQFTDASYSVFSDESIRLMTSGDPDPWFTADLRPLFPEGVAHAAGPRACCTHAAAADEPIDPRWR